MHSFPYIAAASAVVLGLICIWVIAGVELSEIRKEKKRKEKEEFERTCGRTS